ncbi:hypothetical protein MTR67_047714 [Solanum verrucosum]|uniref:Uncharacterized protein n=1 Tax=Solanum verrucosum TaxID=315347 RepID=A0AAF0UZI9_SOLVR|nr:hypothetical protein MTR67_047714 [Solanum verrucosum]
MCYPKEEGGIGFRSLHVIAKALFAKLWWTFRTSTSLWSTFIWNKYCKKHHPVLAKGNGASHTWRKMLETREEVEYDIWWRVKSGEASFWFDNWMKQGALYYIQEHNGEEEVEVRQFIVNREWDSRKLRELLSEEMTNHILENISPRVEESTRDTS